MNFVALDVETSNPNLSSICQIGVVTFLNGIGVEKWQSYVNPEEYFDPMNIYIHEITEEKVKNAPKFRQIYPELSKIISDKGGLITQMKLQSYALEDVYMKILKGA